MSKRRREKGFKPSPFSSKELSMNKVILIALVVLTLASTDALAQKPPMA